MKNENADEKEKKRARTINFLILGEMVNLQKVKWPKSQLAKKTKHSILVILISAWLFGQLTFWRLTISPSFYFLPL